MSRNSRSPRFSTRPTNSIAASRNATGLSIFNSVTPTLNRWAAASDAAGRSSRVAIGITATDTDERDWIVSAKSAASVSVSSADNTLSAASVKMMMSVADRSDVSATAKPPRANSPSGRELPVAVKASI